MKEKKGVLNSDTLLIVAIIAAIISVVNLFVTVFNVYGK